KCRTNGIPVDMRAMPRVGGKTFRASDPARGRLLGPLPPGRRAKVRHEAARVHHAARRCGGRVGSLLEVGRELVSTGVLCRKVSSSIWLTRKSATLARGMNPQVQSRGSTNAR